MRSARSSPGRPGSARRDSSPSSRPRLRREGAAVLYAGGGELTETPWRPWARPGRAIARRCWCSTTPTTRRRRCSRPPAKLAREAAGRPVLICVLHHDEQGPPGFAALLEAGAAERLRLDPLGEEAVAEIAALYAPAEGIAMPLRTLIAESEGVPLRIHRAAGEWARAEAADRLAATAGRAAGERSGLRAAQAASRAASSTSRPPRERTRLYAVAEPPDPPSSRSAHSAAWRRSTPPTPSTSSAASASSPSSSPAWSARPCSRSSAPRERQVLGGARGSAARARRRGRPGLGALAPGA